MLAVMTTAVGSGKIFIIVVFSALFTICVVRIAVVVVVVVCIIVVIDVGFGFVA